MTKRIIIGIQLICRMTIQCIISKNRTAIMGFAMISIMLFHQPFFYDNHVVGFFHLFGFWGVEVFLFVSGFGIVHSLKKNSVKTYYKNRLKRLLPSCLLAGLCKYVFVQFDFFSHCSQSTFLLLTNIYLWYIYAILVYYLLAPFLYKILNKNSIVVFIGVCLFSLGCNYIPFSDSDVYFIQYAGWVTARLPVFVLGMIYALRPINISLRTTVIIGILVYILCMFLQLGSIMVRFQWEIPHRNLLIQFAAPMLCVLSGYMNILAGKLKLSKIPTFLGTLSLEIYLWHEYIYWNIHDDMRVSNMNTYVQCAVAVGISILFAYITHLMATFIQNRDWKGWG